MHRVKQVEHEGLRSLSALTFLFDCPGLELVTVDQNYVLSQTERISSVCFVEHLMDAFAQVLLDARCNSLVPGRMPSGLVLLAAILRISFRVRQHIPRQCARSVLTPKRLSPSLESYNTARSLSVSMLASRRSP
jgi:hypothetical protein